MFHGWSCFAHPALDVNQTFNERNFGYSGNPSCHLYVPSSMFKFQQFDILTCSKFKKKIY